MQRLSSAKTGFYKRSFACLWFGLCAAFCYFSLRSWLHPRAIAGPPIDPMFVLTPLLMVGMGMVLWRGLIPDLIDKVCLDGDAFVFKSRNDNCRVGLLEQVKVNTTTATHPRDPVALDLSRPVDATRQIAR